MHLTRDYGALQQYTHSNLIPALQVTCDQYLSQIDKTRIDYIALHIFQVMPQKIMYQSTFMEMGIVSHVHVIIWYAKMRTYFMNFVFT